MTPATSFRSLRILYSFTIAGSSLLLFLIQPIMAKALLPRFGGSAGVWVACMLFFQVMLLAGYLYSWVVSNHLSRKTQSAVHVALMVLSLAGMALSPTLAMGQPANGNPEWTIPGILLASIGLPYFLLAGTSPLLQAWLANSTRFAFPYRLFALSNAASLAALLAYPVMIEPALRESEQLRLWRIGYCVLAVAGIGAAIVHASADAVNRSAEPASSMRRPLRWIALGACGSTLWMAVANHLSREVAPVPFLWVLPLSIYLLSFILCFDSAGWYRPALFRWLLPVAWIGAGYQIAGRETSGLIAEVAIFSVALFVWCMFCHGEIARSKPGVAEGATFFYLTIAFGGALGGIFVGLIAPNLLSTYLELPIGIAASVLLALRVLYGMTSIMRLARLAVLALLAFVVATRFEAGFGDVVHLRNFYGALQVSDAEAGAQAIRTLYNGRTLHGVEFLSPDRIMLPTAYYGPDSGAGRLLGQHEAGPRRVGLVGLGIGTLAAYGRVGDTFRFYEINPAVIDVATRYFHFLGASAAKVDVRPGDGRLELEREPANSFDVLVLDAFADDTIPVHLLTREAFQTYFRLLRADGAMAVHVTNRYLELAPVVEAATANAGKFTSEIHNAAEPARQILAADWVLVSARRDLLTRFGGAQAEPDSTRLSGNSAMTGRAARLKQMFPDSMSPGVAAGALWTDDYSNLFQVLK